jgi:ribokinase
VAGAIKYERVIIMGTSHAADATSVVVIGSSNTDLVVTVEHLPRPGETVMGGNLLRAAGGKGANQAVAAQRAGASVTFIACLGDDAFGADAIAGLIHEGIDTTYVQQLAGVPSGIALIAVEASGENSIVVAPGANAALTPAQCELARGALTTARYVLAQLEVPLAAIECGFTIARAAGAKTVLNPAPAQTLPAALLALTDMLVCNETEATILSGIAVNDAASAAAAAQKVLNQGMQTVVMTMGSAGTMLFEQGTSTHIPAVSVSVVDTTAAGDAFIGVLVAWLARGEPLALSLRAANVAGALAVQQRGAQPSLPTRTAIQALLALPE